jgi:hypothetical protein
MAYKFQIGASSVSGALEQAGEFSLRSGLASLAGQQPGRRLVLAEEDGNFNIAQHNGSVGLTLSGTLVTALGSELNYVDVTAGTATATKALVLDGSKNIATIGTVGCGAITSTGNSSMVQLTTSGRVIVDDGTDATSKTDGSLQTDGGLSVAKAIYNGTDATLAADSGVVTIGAATSATFSAAGLLNINNATDATSKTDGSLQTDGGLSVAKAIYNGTAATLAADSGVVTMGSTTAATISAAGVVNVNNQTEATSTTDGSLQTDGGLSVAKSAVIGDDLDLLSNGAIFTVGVAEPFTLTHSNANNTLMATANNRLAFGDAGEYITGDGTDLAIMSSGDLDITATLVDVTGAGTFSGILKTDDTTEATSTTDGSLQTDGGLSVAKSAVIGDDLDLLSNGAIFKVGVAEPFTLTHSNASNTLTATANNRLAFGDAGDYITGDGTDLAIVSSGDVDITATLVEVIGSLGVQGNTDLGNATSDTITATGRFDSALVPSTDSARDLGTTALRWSTIYVDSIVGANVALDVENYGPAPYSTTISASVEFALITSGAVRPGEGGALYTLPVPSAGKILYVKLSGSQANVTLSPSAGTRIEALGMNTAIQLESTGSAITCVGMDPVTWWII